MGYTWDNLAFTIEVHVTILVWSCSLYTVCRSCLAVLQQQGNSHRNIFEQLVSEADDHAVKVLPHSGLQHRALYVSLQSLQEHWEGLRRRGERTCSMQRLVFHIHVHTCTLAVMEMCICLIYIRTSAKHSRHPFWWTMWWFVNTLLARLESVSGKNTCHSLYYIFWLCT